MTEIKFLKATQIDGVGHLWGAAWEWGRLGFREQGFKGNLLGNSWELVTIYHWASNPTYSWGNPYKLIYGGYK